MRPAQERKLLRRLPYEALSWRFKWVLSGDFLPEIIKRVMWFHICIWSVHGRDNRVSDRLGASALCSGLRRPSTAARH